MWEKGKQNKTKKISFRILSQESTKGHKKKVEGVSGRNGAGGLARIWRLLFGYPFCFLYHQSPKDLSLQYANVSQIMAKKAFRP